MFRSYWIKSLLLLAVVNLFTALVYFVNENSKLETNLNSILKENAALKMKISQDCMPSKSDPKTITRGELLESTINRRAREFSQADLTIILFKGNGSFESDNENSFNSKVQELSKRFPATKILWNKEKQRLGTAFNFMINQVESEYFLFVEPQILLSERQKESIEFLMNALEEFPELDFIGGSYLSGDKLYVQCHRFRLCRWTFSESYEYHRSLDNVMICDGTSSSFMGRTDGMKKINGFDETIPDLMVVKDFFLRAKASNVVVGTRPNVMFITEHYRSLYELWNSGDITKELVPFAVKHKVFRFKDTEDKIFDICDAKSPLSGKGLCIETNSHKRMLDGGHWAYSGMYAYPYILKYLEGSLLELADFFTRHNVTYFIDAGVALGAIKMRSILPWEAGDIDMGVYGLSLDETYNLLKKLADKKGYVITRMDATRQVNIFCTPRHVGKLQGGIATVFVSDNRVNKVPPKSELIRVQTNNAWITYQRNFVHYLIDVYGKDYLQHKTYLSSEGASCKMKGHNACLPNFKSLLHGKAGTLREYFCEA